MKKVIQSFDPTEQMDIALSEFSGMLAGARSLIEQMQRHADKIAAELHTLRAERDTLEVYTEAEAATLLRLEEKHLAALRRTHRLPHVLFGNKPRYTKEQLAAVCDTLTLGDGRAAVRLKKAA